jgi:hypothetical protein
VIKGHMADIDVQFTRLKRDVKKKDIQRAQLVSMYKKNLSLRSSNIKLAEDVYLAKNMLSKKNLKIFLNETFSSRPVNEGSRLMNNLSNASFLCYDRLAVHFGS